METVHSLFTPGGQKRQPRDRSIRRGGSGRHGFYADSSTVNSTKVFQSKVGLINRGQTV